MATARDIWQAYADQLDASDKTRETYVRALRQYRAYLEECGVDPLAATRETVVSYKRHLSASGRAASTVNGYLTAVRSFYAWTEATRLYPNVAAGVKGQRTSAGGSKEALTLQQARRLLDAGTRGDDLKGLRDFAMVNLMARRGLRTVEIARANVGDIKQVAGEAVLYVQGKGYADKGEFVVLGDDCLKPIYEYLDARGRCADDAPLFAATGNRNAGGRMTTRSISRVAKERMAACGMNSAKLTAHSLRHTAVTFALLGGATVQEAQAMARHASVSTTMIYAHNLDRMSAAAERGVDAYLIGATVPRMAAVCAGAPRAYQLENTPVFALPQCA